MKLRAWLPALAGLALLVAIWLFARTRGDDTAAPSRSNPQPTAVVAAPSPRRPADKPIAPTAPDEATDDDLAHKRPLTPDELKVGTPDFEPKKAKMTLDERLAEAQKHIPVLERRAALIDQEIAKLEAAGKAEQASEQRIVAARLRAHADELKKAIAEHREPM